MEHTQRHEARKTSACLWRSGRPTASSVNSCLQWIEKRPGCPALIESGWLSWGGPQWDVPYWDLFSNPHRHIFPLFGRWLRTLPRVASQPMKLFKESS
eukprot:6187253-Amphidinium_carterae.1